MTRTGKADWPAQGKTWLWFALFVAMLALLGGSSRADPLQNAALRPLAALMLIPAFYHLRSADLAPLRSLLAIGGAWLAWMIVQILPLPPALWQALPGRTIVADLGVLAGAEGLWRPLSLAPFRGLNALMSTIVPIAALLLVLSARVRTQTILLAIVGLGAVNALFGIVQVAGGASSPFYFYALTSRGAPAGIFANENHAGVFAALVLLVIARLALGGKSNGLPPPVRLALLPVYVVVLLGVMISGSRAGLGTALLAVAAGGVMLWRDSTSRARASGSKAHPATGQRRRLVFLAGGVLATLGVIVALVLIGRAPGAADLIESSATIDDLRWSLLPVLGAMMRDHWLVGTGFGSFDAVYRLYEPTSLLFPLYVNQAHNDWAQLVIEGGVPASLCLTGLLAWLGRALLRVARAPGASRNLAIFWLVAFGIIMAASLVDYPLRTPIFQSVSLWLLLCILRDGKAGGERIGSPSSPGQRELR